MSRPDIEEVVIATEQRKDIETGLHRIDKPQSPGPWVFLFGGCEGDQEEGLAPFVAWGRVRSE